MKITIEPTRDQARGKYPHCIVSITHPSDDLSVPESLELIKAALLAWGFDPENLTHLIEE